MHCDHCQTTVVEGAKFCPFCGGKLTDAPVADGAAEAMDPSQAPTVALTVGPCESCGAPSAPRFDAVSALHPRVREHPRHAAGRSGCRGAP